MARCGLFPVCIGIMGREYEKAKKGAYDPKYTSSSVKHGAASVMTWQRPGSLGITNDVTTDGTSRMIFISFTCIIWENNQTCLKILEPLNTCPFKSPFITTDLCTFF